MNIKSDWEVILGSTSPRRRELLGGVLGIGAFSIVAPQVEEKREKNEKPFDYVERLAMEKSRDVAKRSTIRGSALLVIGADTIVIDDDRVLEKPSSPKEAEKTLLSLSGREHEVATAVALVHKSTDREILDIRSFVSRTKVRFRTLTRSEIESYVATGEPMDKAGSYGAQGLAGSFIEHLEGSFTNVIGLPLAQLVTFWRLSFPDCFDPKRKSVS